MQKLLLFRQFLKDSLFCLVLWKVYKKSKQKEAKCHISICYLSWQLNIFKDMLFRAWVWNFILETQELTHLQLNWLKPY